MTPGVNPAWWVRLRGLVHDGDLIVPKDNYFVLGDNRDDSEDSRYWGFVPRNHIVGKPVLIYFSWKLPPTPQPGQNDAEEDHAPGNHGPTDFARWDRLFLGRPLTPGQGSGSYTGESERCSSMTMGETPLAAGHGGRAGHGPG